jgi:hypothetical protein
LVSVGVDVLWNLLDASSSLLKGAPLADSRAKLVAKWRENNAVYRLGSERALWVLKDLLLRLLEAGYRSRDKELRNAVLVLLSFVSRSVEALPSQPWISMSPALKLRPCLCYVRLQEPARAPALPEHRADRPAAGLCHRGRDGAGGAWAQGG